LARFDEINNFQVHAPIVVVALPIAWFESLFPVVFAFHRSGALKPAAPEFAPASAFD
jgi:hypothetical protein